MNAAQYSSVAASVLIAGVAAFQVALALGLPYGEAVLGGRAPTRSGVLTAPFRALAVGQALMLTLLGWVLLARSGLVGIPMGSGPLRAATWVIVGFLVLNALANLTAPHPLERWGMGSITLVLAVLATVVALGA